MPLTSSATQHECLLSETPESPNVLQAAPQNLVFSAPRDIVHVHLKIDPQMSAALEREHKQVAYRVLTTASKLYVVTPASGLINPLHSLTARVSIQLQTGAPKHSHRFQIQAMTVDADVSDRKWPWALGTDGASLQTIPLSVTSQLVRYWMDVPTTPTSARQVVSSNTTQSQFVTPGSSYSVSSLVSSMATLNEHHPEIMFACGLLCVLSVLLFAYAVSLNLMLREANEHLRDLQEHNQQLNLQMQQIINNQK